MKRTKTIRRQTTTTLRTVYNPRSIARYCAEWFKDDLRWNTELNTWETRADIYTNEGQEFEFSEDSLKLLVMWVPCDYERAKGLIRQTLTQLMIQEAKNHRVVTQLTSLATPPNYVAISDELKQLLK